MGPFGSLFPSLQDFRTPLATGALWLTAAYLFIDPHIKHDETGKQASALHQAVYRAWADSGHLDKLIVAAFAAFILGAATAGPIQSAIVFCRYRKELLSRRAHAELTQWISEWIEANPKACPDLLECPSREPLVKLILTKGDQRLLRTQLRLKSAPVAEALDRWRSEGEFRISIAPPLFLLGVAIARTGGQPTWTQLQILLAAFLLALLTASSGWRRVRTAAEDLSLMLITGVITSPRLDRVQEPRAMNPDVSDVAPGAPNRV